ncbi:MAG: sugar ABC transporter ATP-binding protein [Nocardioidaceae bacterium]
MAGSVEVEAEPILRVSGIVKTFPGVTALAEVDLNVLPGEVHCLLGQNGAGKSTLIKVLAGVHRPDSGDIFWEGEKVEPANPSAAFSLGIATIYQELDLVDDLSVAQNIFLGNESSSFGVSRRRAADYAAADILKRLGHGEITPRRMVARLSPAGRQIVSMARALAQDARLIVMDEPSALLSYDEVANLFRVIREVTATGVAVIYISHRLEEIREIGDRITVLKDGRTVAQDLDAHSVPTERVVSLMSGRAVDRAFPTRPTERRDAEALRVRDLARPGEFEDVSFVVHEGEVLGIAGLVGSGRSEILETIFGARRQSRGAVEVRGKKLRSGNVGAAMRAGVGLAPEERKSQALLLSEPIARNMSVSSLGRFASFGWLNRRRELDQATAYARDLDIRPADPRSPARNLSGGNQQKVVLARWLLYGCRVLLLDEPTRGVDVGARSEIYAMIRDLSEQGIAVVIVSSEIPEVIGLSDRVLVLHEGRVIAESEASEVTEQEVLDMVMEGSATVETTGVGR